MPDPRLPKLGDKGSAPQISYESTMAAELLVDTHYLMQCWSGTCSRDMVVTTIPKIKQQLQSLHRVIAAPRAFTKAYHTVMKAESGYCYAGEPC